MKRRETLSALDVFALARELGSSLSGAFVDKVHQIGRDDVAIKLNARGTLGRVNLVVLGGKRVHLTERAVEAPEKVSSFAAAARKRLASGSLLSVEQLGFDRILRINFRRGPDSYTLVAEMLPDGAVALLEGDKIAVVAQAKVFRGRIVRPGEVYIPPRQGPDPRALGPEGLAKAAAAPSGSTVKALSTRAGLGPGLAEEVLVRAEVDGSLDAARVSKTQWETIDEAIHALLGEVEKSPRPTALLEGEALVDFSPVPMRRWRDAPTRAFPTMSALLDAYFELPADLKEQKAQAEAPPSEQDAEVARLERVRAQQRAVVDELEAEIAKAHSAAEAVYANYPQVEQFLRLAKPGGSSRQLVELINRAGLGDASPSVAESGRAILVDLKTPDGAARRIEVPLDATVNEVAQNYYRQASRAKERLQGALAALEETEGALQGARRKQARAQRVELHRRADADAEAQMPAPPRKREWYERFRWMLTSDGHLVVAGRDAGTNDLVVKKYLRPHDRYAHADIHGAPSVVIKRAEGEEEIPPAALEEACAFAAIMSRAWSSGAAEASSFWVTPEQVSKSPESGEALPRGAFIIRGKRNTVRHVALRAAVGGLTIKGERKAMCGPPQAVAHHCDGAFHIAPGRRKATDVAKELAEKIRVHPDEIARALPTGSLEVLGALDIAEAGKASDEEE